MSSVLAHKFLFYAADFLRGDRSVGKLKQLNRSQYWDKNVLRKWRIDKLNIILNHARKNSSFYKKRLEDIKLPIKDEKFFQDIPILTKKNINSNIDEIKCENVPAARFVKANTGGSTGEPLHFFCDRISLGWRRAAMLRNGSWAGLRLGGRNAQMTGSHYEYTKRQKTIGKLKLWLLNSKNMPIAFLTEQILGNYYKQIVSWKPESVWGYASGVYQLAKFIKKNHPGACFNFVKAIITSSETLQEYQRELLNDVFGKDKVFDHYGAAEFYIAAECPLHNGYHVNSDIFHLEISDSNGMQKKPGELGKIVITDFNNFAFPLIRYEIGDAGFMAVENYCRCGIKLPLLGKVEGRVADMVILPNRVLTAPNFTNIFRAFKGIDQYQIVQKSISNIEVIIVKNELYNGEFEEHIKKSLNILLGEGVNFSLSYVAQIEVPKSGKRRFVVSKVAKDNL
ncbi:MAG: phenylacetate--CoA ligase family protein [Candidatus Omnitrophica bacterium]|nr:phenylacetate--CoA ligase family protein [Candidatus Omnitrophota bacterium]